MVAHQLLSTPNPEFPMAHRTTKHYNILKHISYCGKHGECKTCSVEIEGEVLEPIVLSKLYPTKTFWLATDGRYIR